MISQLIILMSVPSLRVEKKSWGRGDWSQDTKEGKMVILNNVFRNILLRERTKL